MNQNSKRTSAKSLKNDYLIENDLTKFNKWNNNNYTRFLEKRLVKAENRKK